jgi:hypothetical protein
LASLQTDSRETLVLSAEIRAKLHHYLSIFNQSFTEKSLREKCCVELLNLKSVSKSFFEKSQLKRTKWKIETEKVNEI